MGSVDFSSPHLPYLLIIGHSSPSFCLLVGLIGPYTKIVLAGDSRQLAPAEEIIAYFRKNGITTSLFERYERNINYVDDPYTFYGL